MLSKDKAKTKRPANKKAAEIDGGCVVVCALCGKIIKSPDRKGSKEMLIYSICPACKRLPPHAI